MTKNSVNARGLFAAAAIAALAIEAAAQKPAAPAEPVHAEPLRKKGWSWTASPDQVTPQSGRRNHIFFVGEPVAFELKDPAAAYEVRDYWGNLVDSGRSRQTARLKVTKPGWYKLYVYQGKSTPEWGDIVGTTTFVIFRRNPNFADPKAEVKENPNYYPAMDQVTRAVTGMGPQRHAVQKCEKPDEEIARIKPGIDYDTREYVPRDPVRQRALMCAFPNGTKDLAGVKKIVETYKNQIRYWEPRNEPNYGASPEGFVENELKGFYETVKSVDPGLKVMGPGTVSIGPQLQGWLHGFFKAGGAKYIDAFSFHIYNGINGDLQLGRRTLDSLQEMLEEYGVGGMEKWQTEQGYFAALYGAFQPRLQGRWTMLEMMLFEQYGLPKERNHLWYDRSHGFWDFPTWFVNDDGGYNPAAPLMRVMSEELHGTTFEKRLDFGKNGNVLFIGSVFKGKDKRVAAIMNAGCGEMPVTLKVVGGLRPLKVVSAFGEESTLAVSSGKARLVVPDLPVYVQLGPGQTVDVEPIDWGRNLLLSADKQVKTSGTGAHPADASIPNDIGKIFNGFYENWYWAQSKDAQPWMDDTKEFPAWIEIALPKPAAISRVAVFGCVPWQWQGTLVDHEVQIDQNGQWVTVGRISEPLRTFGVFSPPTRTTVDTFFSDRSIFVHEFSKVTTSKIRVFVHNTTFGGGASQLVVEAGGQTGPHHVMLREIEAYE